MSDQDTSKEELRQIIFEQLESHDVNPDGQCSYEGECPGLMGSLLDDFQTWHQASVDEAVVKALEDCLTFKAGESASVELVQRKVTRKLNKLKGL